MNSPNFDTYKTSIIRLLYQEQSLGIGFLVAEGYALTCAHVVAQALSASSAALNPPDGEVQVDFPLINPTQKSKATIACWYPELPLNSKEAMEDIAVLKLENLPHTVHPTRLILSENLSAHPFKAFGCPSGIPFGVWATGVLLEPNAKQWVQLEGTRVTGYGIEAGFSGSPVWDEQLQGVVGMVVAAERRREAARAAFMIPAQTLVKAIPNLESISIIQAEPIEKQMRSPLLPARKKFLEQQKQYLEGNIEQVSRQMGFEANLSNYLNLERQVTVFFEKLEEIERELSSF